MRLSQHQREHLADMFKDSANVILAALVVSGFVERRAQWTLVVGGIILYGLLVILTTTLRKRG